MKPLFRFLLTHDTGFLSLIAENWNFGELDPNCEYAAQDLANIILNPDDLSKKITTAPKSMRGALADMLICGGKIPRSAFEKKYGQISICGIEKIRRELRWRNPTNVAEWLWYHGLLFFIFDSTSLSETAVIPGQICELLRKNPHLTSTKQRVNFATRPANLGEINRILLGNDSFLDLCCFILAAERNRIPLEILQTTFGTQSTIFVRRLLLSFGCIHNGETVPEKIKELLSVNRRNALYLLFESWVNERIWDDLRQIPELDVDTAMQYDSYQSRRFVIGLISTLESGKWWSSDGFITAIESYNADFMGRSVNSPVWLVRNVQNGRIISGSDAWNQIEGAYIRHLIFGPLSWMGLIDGTDTSENRSFRVNVIGKWLFHAHQNGLPDYPKMHISECETPSFTIDGRVKLTPAVSRLVRYQFARFTEWEKISKDLCVLRITPASLTHAEAHGLKISAIRNFIIRCGGKRVPKKLIASIDCFQKTDANAVIMDALLLSVSNADLLRALLIQKDTNKFIISVLNETTAIIQRNGENAVRRALADLEILTDRRY